MGEKRRDINLFPRSPNIKLAYIVGMHFSQSVSIIQSQVGVIRGVQVLYSDTVSILNIYVSMRLVHLSIMHTN